ncbi:GatB/YqeY domain-containing protein [Salirhabdus sp. Marseille-P4669]|uniref:GatB/YqeY domain-containing protein n=1 Tax=Salirhabdus sp. Marseille-P4669 TaxID=2042310 RepID=UPI000C7DED3A|nr:GatB/YqeY domain-containing protein [Salirhabdus sp. Marseille-P4669]
MTLLEKLNQDMKEAMKSKDKMTLSVIRMVKASIQNEAIKLGKPQLTEDEELSILSREFKQRNESLQEFKDAGREDLVEKIEQEIIVLQKYMPEQLSDDELEKLVKEVIQKTGAESKSDMGKVMGALMPKVKGKADGGKVNKLVMENLSK